MEETFLHVFFVVMSLLLSNKHVLHEQDDDVTASMQDHNHVWQQGGAKLEEPSIATDLPHSNQQASQSMGGEGDMSDVKQIMPNVRTAVPSWASHMSNTVDQTGSNVDQNFSQGEEELPKKGQIDTHHDNQASLLGQVNTYRWCFWKILSLISLIRFLKWIVKLDIKAQAKMRSSQRGKKATKFLNTKVSEMDYKTLTSFYNKFVQTSNSLQTCEFVEGFANDLMETVGDKNPDMKIENCVCFRSLSVQRDLRKSLVCDIHVPITPLKPYSFEIELLRDRTAPSALYSTVKMVKETDSNICVCNDSIQEDTLCLLHPDIKQSTENYIKVYMCQEDSPYLTTTRVEKWFANAIKQAWEEIRHKYNFELVFRTRESLKIRFRSGKVILFNITPVVRFRDSEAHLISYLPSIGHSSDTHWPLCLAHYENSLLQHLTNTLSYNSCHISCLQILSILHNHQVTLTGKCGLTNYHLINAMLHLLLADTPSSWTPEQIGRRLNDVLTFLQQRVKAKLLHHALVGNSLIPSNFGFPKEFRERKPINLFQSLVSDEELYLKTDQHLVEMIKNIPVIVYEYSTEKKKIIYHF